MLTVGERTTHWDAGNGVASPAISNRIVWRLQHGRRQLLAIGASATSGAPLPPDAIDTDLVAASGAEPALAAELWGPFLTCVAHGVRRPWVAVVRARFHGLPVCVRIDDRETRAAVRSVLSRVAVPTLHLRDA